MAIQRRSHVSPVAVRDNTENKPSESSNSNTFSFSLNASQTTSPSKRQPVDTDYRHMKKDLIKTVIITSVILISEFLLTKWLPR